VILLLSRALKRVGQHSLRDTAAEHLLALALRDSTPDAVPFAILEREGEAIGPYRARGADLFRAPCLVV
jgi:hypothetical protein